MSVKITKIIAIIAAVLLAVILIFYITNSLYDNSDENKGTFVMEEGDFIGYLY